MATFSSMGPIAHYKLDAEGWDAANARLADASGFGNHLGIVNAASPTYATRDGFQCIDFTNTYYFHGEWALPPLWSGVFVGCVNLPGVEGTCYPFATARNKTADNNHTDALTLTDAEFLTGSYLRKALSWNTNAPRNYDGIGAVATAPAWTAGAMNAVTFATTRSPHGLKIANGVGAAVFTAFSGTQDKSSGSATGQFVRVGQLKGTLGALTAGNYVSGKRLYLFAGDVFEHPDYASALAAEIAQWGI